MANAWVSDPERRQYHGYVTEDPATYDGPGYNVFKGYPIQPTLGDASLFIDYIENILCGGDKALAHWVTTYIADGVQRPWSERPGTGLALRGPQGGGKSFLGFALEAVLGHVRKDLYPR
jgi:putative DNA primase/helicase